MAKLHWRELVIAILLASGIPAHAEQPASGQVNGSVNITIDVNALSEKRKKDGTSAWMTYQLMAGAWQGDLFKKNFPDEKQYRHSLAEELAGLDMVADRIEEDLKKGELKEKDLDPGIAMLLKLHEAKMTEPYILLSRADEGIAKDYEAYREKNRDKLRQYIGEFVIQKAQ